MHEGLRKTIESLTVLGIYQYDVTWDERTVTIVIHTEQSIWDAIFRQEPNELGE